MFCGEGQGVIEKFHVFFAVTYSDFVLDICYLAEVFPVEHADVFEAVNIFAVGIIYGYLIRKLSSSLPFAGALAESFPSSSSGIASASCIVPYSPCGLSIDALCLAAIRTANTIRRSTTTRLMILVSCSFRVVYVFFILIKKETRESAGISW